MNALPAGLEAKMAALAERVRRGLLIQGVCRLGLTLAILAVSAILLDAYSDMPRWLRCLEFGLWAFVGLGLNELWICGPLRAPLDRLGLAALVEKRYPRLDERLLTAVDLAAHPERANGSPEWMRQILGEADRRTETLDFAVTLPLRGLWIFAASSAVALPLLLLPLVFVENSPALVKRFALPWRSPAADDPFRIVSTTGNAGVARGGSITLAGYFEPLGADVPFPAAAAVVLRISGAPPEMHAVAVEQGNVFHLKRERVAGDFEYRFESGRVVGDWHRVRAVEPIALVGGGAAVTAPEYARRPGELPRRTAELGDLAALQFSALDHALTFSRPPLAARVEWRGEGGEANGSAPVILPSALVGETLSFQSSAQRSGQYRLRVEAEEGVTFDWPAQPLRVAVDKPPRFTRVAGFTEGSRTVRPDEGIAVDFAVEDDIGLGPVHLEYRVNSRDEGRRPIPLRTDDTPRGAGRLELALRGLVKDGDTFEYRLVAFDNRSVPGEKLGPQRAVYPPGERWAELRISSAAEPLDEQEIESRRRRVGEQLKEVLKDLEAAQRGAYKLKADSAGKRSLTREQGDTLREVREKVGTGRTALDALARENEVVPDLKPLTDGLREVAGRPLAAADAALAEAQHTPGDPRQDKLQRGEESLGEAIRSIEELRALNDRLAREQRTRQQVERLGRDQQAAAESAKAAAPEASSDLDIQQAALQDRLRRLLADNGDLRDAQRAGASRDAKELADRLGELAVRARELADAGRDGLKAERAVRLADLGRRQGDLARRVEDFVRRSAPTATANRLPAASAAAAKRADDDLREGRPAEAELNQTRSEVELGEYARKLAEAAARARDPRQAADQLSNMVDDLRRRIAEQTRDGDPAKLPAATRAALADEQKALADAVDSLKLPPGAESAAAERRRAAEAAREAVDRLEKKAPRPAVDDILQKSRDSLRKLADLLPPLEARTAGAKRELESARRDLETLTRQAEQALRTADRRAPDGELARELAGKLADSGRRLEQLGEAVKKLDLPDQAERLNRVREALRRAAADVKAGRAQDIPGSLQGLKRELDRLEAAAQGQASVEDQLADLAKRQADLKAEVDGEVDRLVKKPKPDRDRWNELAKKQAEIGRRLQNLNLNELPRAKDDALTLSRRADQALTDARPDDAKAAAAETAERLQGLRDRLAKPGDAGARAGELSRSLRGDAGLPNRPPTPAAAAEQKRQLQATADELRQIPAGDGAAAAKREALEKLRLAATATGAEFPGSRAAAAEAVRKFAEGVKAAAPEVPEPEAAEAKPGALPQAAQAEEAARLAREQKALREETSRARERLQKPTPGAEGNPLAEIVELQKLVVKIAGELARDTPSRPKPEAEVVETAKRADGEAGRALGDLANGRVAAAKASARAAKALFDKLAGEMLGRVLSQREQEVIDRLEKLTPQAGRAQQAARREELRRETETLREQYRGLAQRAAEQPEVQKAARQSAESTGRAEEGMRQSQARERADQPEASERALREAVGELEKALETARALADPAGGKAQAGQALSEAQKEMAGARQQLGRGQPGKAEPAMQKAADALRQAVRQLQEAQGQPSERVPAAPGGSAPLPAAAPPDLAKVSPEYAKHAGKAWGDLPGEAREKILQDLKARYGEDYATKIRYYFESIAERK